MQPTGRAAYLRVHQSLAAFPARERTRWATYVDSGALLPAHQLVQLEERESLARMLGLAVGEPDEHAFIERRGRNVYVCPLMSELRALEALLAFRHGLPDEVVDAFLPANDLEWAARTVRRLRGDDLSATRSHIQQAAWSIPVCWFLLFDPAEREILPGSRERPPRLLYVTMMNLARTRITRALKALAEMADEPDVARAAGDLRDWLYDFDPDSLIILDYGGIARTVPFGELLEDHSVREAWEAITALEEGELERASDVYVTLRERWIAFRGMAFRN